MTSSPGWSLARRIGFRFGVLFGALLVYPFPIGQIPKTGWLATAMGKPFEWGTHWLAENVLGLSHLVTESISSGDRTFDYVQLLMIAIVGALGTIVWSIVDRRRRAYPGLAAGAYVVLRYWVGYELLDYGVAKILKSQFPDLPPSWLHARVGDISPMRLLWTFMGYSTPYTVFAGLAEAIGGALLLWRRTATLGALLVVAVMTNVVLLNLCYDVPVKLFSLQLLIAAGLIAVPGARRLIGAVLGRATAEVPPRVRMSSRRERVRLAVKAAILALVAIALYGEYADRPNRNAHVHELHGTWNVVSFTADGVEHPPLTTDPVRWQTWTANALYTSIWLMTGGRDGQDTPSWGSYPLEVDAANRSLTLTIDEERKTRETWNYTQPAPDQLVIDGIHGGKYLHVALHREPDPPLTTRGFHWINEVPFNR